MRAPLVVLVWWVGSCRGETAPSCNPSLCYNGFVVNNDRCPYLLGRGFGPLPYHKLCTEWTVLNQSIKSIDSIPERHIQAINFVLSSMSSCDDIDVKEGVLSNRVAIALFRCFQLMYSENSDDDTESWYIMNQMMDPGGTDCAIDIAVCTRDVPPYLDAVMEMKWNRERDKFPAGQAAACAALFSKSLPEYTSWMPVFAMSKSHCEFGVAFAGVGRRWAYTEIDDVAITVSPKNSESIIQMYKIVQFLIRACKYHRNCPMSLLIRRDLSAAEFFAVSHQLKES
jgi:hypothetical protein